MHSKTILVTGVAGFIGSNLADTLVDLGYKVIGVDNFNDFYDPEIKRRNIAQLHSRPSFSLVEADIRKPRLFDTLFRKHAVDTVVHLAARAGVRPSLEQPHLYWDVNVMGSLNLLEAMKLNQVKHFVFASSSSVYGNRTKGPFKESDSTDIPISPYSASKKALELLAHTYAYQYQIKTTGLRFFNAYGPRNRPDMAPYLFVDALVNNRSINQFGDGQTGRDYTYIGDIVDGIVKAIVHRFDYEIINLGNSYPILLTDMIKVMESVTGKKTEITVQPKRAGDVDLTYADNTKAAKLLNWQPQTTFETGAKHLYDWYKQSQKKQK